MELSEASQENLIRESNGAELPELTIDFVAEDTLGNAYDVVVRYDESIADQVSQFPGNVVVISTADAEAQDFPTREMTEQKALGMPDHETLERQQGAYHIMAYPLNTSPEAIGSTVHTRFSFEQSGPQPGEASALFVTSTGTVDFTCTTGNSMTFKMTAGMQSGGQNFGSLMARQETGACGGASGGLNSTSYWISTAGPEVNTIGAVCWGCTQFPRIDPSNTSQSMTGTMSVTVHY